jgi:hypothetical protein
MHESYGSGINTGASGDRVFPLELAVTMNMPDPNNIGVAQATKARIYSEGLSGDSWGLSVFNFGGGPGGIASYVVPVEHRGISSYAMEMAELIPSFLSTVWTTNNGSCAFYRDGCHVSVDASLVELGALLPHMRTTGAHPLRIVSRLLLEAPPPDALPHYHCMHVISVSEGDSPTVVK